MSSITPHLRPLRHCRLLCSASLVPLLLSSAYFIHLSNDAPGPSQSPHPREGQPPIVFCKVLRNVLVIVCLYSRFSGTMFVFSKGVLSKYFSWLPLIILHLMIFSHPDVSFLFSIAILGYSRVLTSVSNFPSQSLLIHFLKFYFSLQESINCVCQVAVSCYMRVRL